MNKPVTTLVLLSASALLLSGCAVAGLATGVGAAVGVSAAREGGIKGAVTDESIRMTISDLWFKKDVNMFSKLNLTVEQGRVLVTGVVQNPEDRVEAIRLAWQAKGVKQVINEIRVGKSGSVGSFAEDTWISGQLRTRLTFEKNVQSINYSIETVHGTVYLMGIAQRQKELDTVIRIARRIKGVKEVISYVKFAGEDVATGSSAQSGYSAGTSNQGGSSYSGNAPTNISPDNSGYTDTSSSTYSDQPPSSASPAAVESEVLPP